MVSQGRALLALETKEQFLPYANMVLEKNNL